MSLRWEQVVVDATDPITLGRWWAEALGWTVVNDDPLEFEIREKVGLFPGILFEPVDAAKPASKNRLHFDFRPDDHESEVRRLVELGARLIDVGQGDDVSWVVLADPEGNEFCVLSGSVQ